LVSPRARHNPLRSEERAAVLTVLRQPIGHYRLTPGRRHLG
jgi:hypothetical protein